MDLIITDEPNRLIHLAGRELVDDTPKRQCHLWVECSKEIEGKERPSLIERPRQLWNRANYDRISELQAGNKEHISVWKDATSGVPQ